MGAAVSSVCEVGSNNQPLGSAGVLTGGRLLPPITVFVLPGSCDAGRAEHYHPQITDKEAETREGSWRETMGGTRHLPRSRYVRLLGNGLVKVDPGAGSGLACGGGLVSSLSCYC